MIETIKQKHAKHVGPTGTLPGWVWCPLGQTSPSPLQILAWLSPCNQLAWNNSNRFLLRQQRRPVTLRARPRGQGSLVPTATALTVCFIHFCLFKHTKQRKGPLSGPQNYEAPGTRAASMSPSFQGHCRMRMTSKEAVAACAGSSKWL